jgi:hypothetical protein
MSSVMAASRPSFPHLSASSSSLQCMGAGFADESPRIKLKRSSENLEVKSHVVIPIVQKDSGVVSPERPASRKATSEVPLKAYKFDHLRSKYLPELEYMLVEFTKLEKQLLGAKGRENVGSKERREKLHSFILHLDETIQQIKAGAKLEQQGKATLVVVDAQETALSDKLPQEKRDEEAVQKLEEHILANLLPVKVRLKKQLAAQQGAKHNPAGMPVRGTISTAYGKPLEGGGSSLTQKLHGSTLGSNKSARTESCAEKSKKILFGGMAIGSRQLESSVHAASSAHRLIIKDPALFELHKLHEEPESFSPRIPNMPDIAMSNFIPKEPPAQLVASNVAPVPLGFDRQRRRSKRKRHGKKNDADAGEASKKRKAAKRGPRAVEYICALCNEVYPSTCEYNTWWALQQQECPKCRKTQVRSELLREDDTSLNLSRIVTEHFFAFAS